MLGVTLADIEQHIDVGTDRSSVLFTSRGCGEILGSILIATLFDRFNHYVTFGVYLTLSGVTMVLFAISGSYVMSMIMVFLKGVFLGALNCGKGWCSYKAHEQFFIHLSRYCCYCFTTGCLSLSM